jgi:hypothetical protein
MRPVPRSSLERLPSFEGSQKNVLGSFLSEGARFRTTFQIWCTTCEQPAMTFSTKERADDTAVAAEGCAFCGAKTLNVDANYGISENYFRAMQQGLWLEYLAGNALRRFTELVWCGQMVGLSEVDGLAIFADELILVECKDTSFGLNDSDIAAAKAQRIGADSTIIITTSDIHPNVLEAASGGKSRLISDAAASSIESQLNQWLEQRTERYVEQWMAGGSSSLRWYYEDLAASIIRS